MARAPRRRTRRLRRPPGLPVHAALEAYSVLTRLPAPFRAQPRLVADFLSRAFPARHLGLDVEALAALPARLARTRHPWRCGR